MVAVFTWQMAGYTMIIYIAGIQNVPDEVLEAARVDGAESVAKADPDRFPAAHAFFHHLSVPDAVRRVQNL